MHDNRSVVEARLARFVRERLPPALYAARHPLTVESRELPGEPVGFEEATAGTFSPTGPGARWGRPWSTTWFHITGQVPQEWIPLVAAGGVRAEMVVDLGFNRVQTGFQCEGLIWDAKGHPLKAIAPMNAASREAIDPTGRIDVFLEAAGNPDLGAHEVGSPDLWTFRPTADGSLETAGRAPLYTLTQVDVALADVGVWELAQDVRVLAGLLETIPVGVPRRAEVLRTLEAMMDAVDPHDLASTAQLGRARLAEQLAKPAHASAHTLHAVGHAHIDSAWLWPLRETIRKCARTFSNVVSLMDEYPDFTFACSSAQQFAWMKEHYPSLYERIRAKVALGQFVPVGGMWVESDTNLPGSEALARQFVVGKRFFREEFGVDCEEVWLPDSFGYSGSLPQIVTAAGCRWFLTQKISWNQTNRMPHHTFWWEGIDGTRVFTHFPPVDKYNSDLCAADLDHAEKNYSEQGAGTTSLMPFGYGDGGGGPTREMIATVHRTTSLEGSPRVVASTPRTFFTAAEAEYPNAPVWWGELYLEAQRGTYTSQLPTKQGNRRSEALLREAELWATTAAVRTGHPYPYDDLERLWRTVLLLQFHDILPGSSIAWVHREAETSYEHLGVELGSLIDSSTRALLGTGEASVVLNAAPHERHGIPALAGGRAVVPTDRGRTRRTEEGLVLENSRVRATFDDRGLLISLVDLTRQRETVPPGEVGNLFQLHRDIPNEWDAWDIDDHYRNVVVDLTDREAVEIQDGGDSVRVSRTFGASRLTQTITLAPGEARLDIVLDVDWHERQKLLKLAFPIDVAAGSFSSETQFGHIDRPTHTNTSWDYARFETCAHRWIRVADAEYGVAVLNDSTYGHDVSRRARRGGGSATLARLSILRAPLYPDPEQDQGHHRLRVSVALGADVTAAVAGGYQLNTPERVVSGVEREAVEPLVSSSNPGVVIEAVKLAEDRSGDVVVRLYEARGVPATTSLVPGFAAALATLTDLLEDPVDDQAALVVASGGASISLRLRPFQIMTVRIVHA